MEESIKLYTVCLIVNDSRILLLNRQHDDYKGFIAPGGRIEFPESPIECAIREVQEETGLLVRNLKFKGLAEYMNPDKERYMIFNYITHDFEGTLIEDGREGKPEWVRIADISDIDMQENFKRRIPLFFKEGTFETHMNRYQEGMKEEHVIKM
ncbi:8-oxo-dGTP diphosphatase [Paenibacillus lactis]|uniref:8-oxo-dGTP diphosphatase n=1 Tax=Paenibacillus lactis TaxID=228574 RepID=UPI00203C584B|nr:8-oxo-dGTP diphosphatase [Paenibacillus lactis]